jgi:hypothetical protein
MLRECTNRESPEGWLNAGARLLDAEIGDRNPRTERFKRVSTLLLPKAGRMRLFLPSRPH